MAILGDTKAISLTLLDGVIGNLNPKTTTTYDLGTSNLKWNNIYGNLKGNADTATKATQDGDGNTITSRYVTLDTTQTISGAKTFSSPIYYGKSGSNAIFAYSSSYPNYGIWYHDWTTDAMTFSANSKANSTTEAELCITGGKLYNANKMIPNTGNTSGTVGATDQAIYSNAGVLTAITTANLKAGKDGDGNTISSTYLKLSGGTVTGEVTFSDETYADSITAGSLMVTGNTTFSSLQGNGTFIYDIGTVDATADKKFLLIGNNRYLSLGAGGVQAYTGATSASTTGILYVNYSGGNVQLGQSSSIKAPLITYGETYLKAGHLYLDGANASSSNGNTTQIVFRSGTTQQVALSSNTSKLIINPTSSATSGQIILNAASNGASAFTSGSLTINAASSSNTGGHKLYVNGTAKITDALTAAAIGDSTHSQDTAASLIVSGGLSVAKKISTKEIRIDNNQSSEGVSLQYDESLDVLNFVFS